MKLLGRIVVGLAGLILLPAASICFWLYLDTADLPTVATLDQYAPRSAAEIRTGPGSITHVVPADQFRKYLLNAVLAAEGQPDSRGPIRVTLFSFFSASPQHNPMYSLQIARSFQLTGHSIRRETNELRLAQHIYHRFNQQQVLTIYMNRVSLGQNVNGVEDASIRYFGKHAADLSLDEAALIAGLINSPTYNSPINHPERAVQRRNRVIDNMVRQGTILQTEAEKAKAAPVIVKQTANSDPSYDWSRCALTLASHAPPVNGSIRTRSGERYNQTPVITFEVLESGDIKSETLSRSSGVADIDTFALTSIQGWKYKERPPGCGVLEYQATVNVDF